MKSRAALAKVDWIDGTEYSGGTVQWQWFTTPDEEERCVYLSSLGDFSTNIDWGDGYSQSILIHDDYTRG
jgi:hypothetical protein